MTRAPSLAVLAALAAAGALATGCVSPSGADRHAMNTLLAQRQYAQAEALVDSSKQSSYGQRNEVLFYLDKGMIQHHQGKYKESDASFDIAERRMDELYTKSITKAAGLMVLNDGTMDYAGEPHERALLNVVRALNYVFQGKRDEALVESRKVERFLEELNDKLGGKGVYHDDAFARYLDALLYADDGKMDDARISYQAAMEAYESYATDYGVKAPKFDFPKMKKRGELVFIHYNGVAPRKVSKTFQVAWNQALITMRQSDDTQKDDARIKNALTAGFMGNAVTVSYPDYQQDPFKIARSELKIDGQDAGETLLVEDVGAIAKKALADRLAVIKARSIARATIKFVLAEVVGKAAAKACDQMPGGYFAVQACKLSIKGGAHAAAAASEFADTRAWGAVPAQIRLARVKVAPGKHDVAVIYKDAAGVMVSSETFSGVEIADRQRAYLAARTAQ